MVDNSVAASVEGEPKVAVAFSGGLDSSIVAKCALSRTEVVACTAFAKGSGDGEKARRAAAALGIEFAGSELTRDNVRDALATLDLPFAPSLMDRSLWCLYRVVAGRARDAGADVLLLGQLADELFGGYAKYAEKFLKEGSRAAAEMMNGDALEYSRRGRIRDVGACGDAVEPRFPFEAREVVELAGSIPVSFKIKDGVRKAVLRKAAAILGVPDEQAGAEKKAAQYSSGVQKLVAGSRF